MNKKTNKCYTCGHIREMSLGKIVVGQIFVCQKCIPKILSLHIYTQPIKWLCPHCQGQDLTICAYCDLGLMVKRAKIG